MKLGLVTYNLAKDWDIPTIIDNCSQTGFEAVELRTTHAHGVEPSLSKAERQAVKKRFADSPVRLLSLGTTCEYHSTDPQELENQIAETKSFIDLAADVGARGIKVRPNGFPDDESVSREQTLDQIGRSLNTCGEYARKAGVQIWLEIHGHGTSHVPYMKHVMEVADHESVGLCWNSNNTDVVNGSVKSNFDLVKDWIRNVHINELWSSYPWRELLALLKQNGYEGYCCAEIPASCEPKRLMQYYAALFSALLQ